MDPATELHREPRTEPSPGALLASLPSAVLLFAATDWTLGLVLSPSLPTLRQLAFWGLAVGLLAGLVYGATTAMLWWWMRHRNASAVGTAAALVTAIAAAHLAALDGGGIDLRRGLVVAALAIGCGFVAGLAAEREPRGRRWLELLVGTAPVLVTLVAGGLLAHRLSGSPWISVEGIAVAAAGTVALVAAPVLLGRLPPPARSAVGGALLALWVVLAAVPASAGWSTPARPRPKPVRGVPRPPILLVTLDTVRADELGCHGAAISLDAFCRDAVGFTGAIASAPWTLPSLTSYLTGLPVSVHRVTDELDRVPERLPTLAERLTTAGYSTAVGGNSPLLAIGDLDRGFGTRWLFPRGGARVSLAPLLLGDHDERLPAALAMDASTDRLFDHALAWIVRQPHAAWFVWLHDFEPHHPYAPPHRLLSRSPPASLGWTFDRSGGARSGLFVPTAAERGWIAALHRAEVAAAAERLARLFARLRAAGLYEQALIIIAGDHGEELWEHGGHGHGHSLHREVVAVPLLIKPPRTAGAGRRVDGAVAALRLHATILAAAGIPPPARIGRLRPLGLDAESDLRTEAVESSGCLYFGDCFSLVEGSAKLVRRGDGEALYDLAADPAERRPILAGVGLEELSAAVDARRAAAATARSALGLAEQEAPPRGMDSEDLRRLRALGYLP